MDKLFKLRGSKYMRTILCVRVTKETGVLVFHNCTELIKRYVNVCYLIACLNRHVVCATYIDVRGLSQKFVDKLYM